jgi:tRNA A37 threonylcarbamoyladenosine biosynthesis protein TsaE
MSAIRGPTNVKKWLKPFTGRRIEMHKLFKYLCENKVVTLTGDLGMGKTHLSHEVSYLLNSRHYFMSGNYYFDLKTIKTSEQLKDLLKNEN